ncbi:MAG: carboxylesterase/lipase family protein [Promethearchaeota archaeon]
MKITIKTRLGDVIGLQHDDHLEFLGIRYAKPPVGELRFKPPVLIDEWQPPQDATQYGPMCYQAHVDDPPINLPESEDCLSLNIFTPKTDENERPVMVYIHGGAFVIGSASRPRLHGANLALKGDVVVVTLQYRLGVLGFFNHDGVSPNLGIQDQICALQWIQKNIGDYGGDSNNVTILGQSAGSMSVNWLMVTPKAKGLFHKAIGQSCAIGFSNKMNLFKTSKKTNEKFFKNLNSSSINVKTLQKLPIEPLIEAERKMLKGNFIMDRYFFPFPDGEIIPKDYKDLWKNGHAKDIPLIIGVNENELPLFSSGMIVGKLKQWFVKTLIINGLRKEMQLSKEQFNEFLSVYQEYYQVPPNHKYAMYEAFIADMAFWIFTQKVAELHSTLNNTYVYMLSYKAPKINASPHCFDLMFMFGHPTSKDFAKGLWLEGTSDQFNLSVQMMDSWINFARSGDPNNEGLPTWEKYEANDRFTMFFDIPCRIVKSPREKIRLAWEKVINLQS